MIPLDTYNAVATDLPHFFSRELEEFSLKSEKMQMLFVILPFSPQHFPVEM